MAGWDGIDAAPFLRLAQEGFARTIDAVSESKTLLIDPMLAGPLGLVSDVGALRQRGVEKMFWLEEAGPGESGGVQAPTRQLLYLCRPEIRWMRTVHAHMEADTALHDDQHYAYTIAFVPNRTEPCLQYLRRHTLTSRIHILDFGLEFIPLGPDLLSLEDDAAWVHTFAHGDHTSLFRAAQALMTMQCTYGLFPRIVGKGDMANRLCDLLVRQRREQCASDVGSAALQTLSPQIDALVVLDRTVDLVTPFSTQLTYEGLIDEVFSIANGFVEVDAAWVGAASAQAQARAAAPVSSAKRKVRLDGVDDALFHAIRDDNFAIVGEKLHTVAKRLSKDYEGRHKASSVHEIRSFVSKLGNLQSEHASLRLHTSMTEALLRTTKTERFHRVLEVQQNLVAGYQTAQQLQALEELMLLKTPGLTVLRLACIACLLGAVSRGKWLDQFRTSFVQTYGFEFLPLLVALAEMRILCVASHGARKSSQFSDVRRPLALIDDEVDERAPQDVSYVFSGYAPLSVRLVQTICQHPYKGATHGTRLLATRIAGWRNVDEAIVKLRGATFDFLQTAGEKPALPQQDTVQTTVVFFLGGSALFNRHDLGGEWE
ncbi:hypothetical protein MVES_002138 [Malassezia vespertilionis]|uniref:Vps33p n=1 Tax=Malassezia vespertilionis TaxID=2020962 RepID=A0A2N1JC53_9BASI|nr:hypothetical protein MVES_002138 [Malassezia vespertilionis]